MRRVVRPLILISFVVIGLVGSIVVPPVSAAPSLQAVSMITSPKNLTTVRGNVVIEGSATHPNFWKYEVAFAREPNPSNWALIGDVHENAVVNGRLEVWNTATVPDGTYSLRLRVVRKDGNYDEYYVRQLTVGNKQPTETPTPAETATPSQPTITSTPLPSTPTVVIQQPKRETPTATASPTGKAAIEPTATPANQPTISTQAMLSSFCQGSEVVLGVFAAVGVLFIVRGILLALYRWVRGKLSKKDDDDDY
jgi:hypothetical protein